MMHNVEPEGEPENEPENESEMEHTTHEHKKERKAAFNPADLIKKIASEAKSGFRQPEPGLYSAIVTKIEPVQFETGLAVRASYVLDYRNVDEEIGVFKDSQIFRMTKADMETPDDWGPDFYGRFMSKLGYSQENRGQEAWDEIAEVQPGIALKIVRAVAKDGSKTEYRNRQIVSPLDDDDEGVAYIKETIQSRPF